MIHVTCTVLSDCPLELSFHLLHCVVCELLVQMKLFVVENFSKMNGSMKQSSYNTSVLYNLPTHTCKNYGSKWHFLPIGNALYTINTPQSTLIEKNPTSFKG